MLTEFVGVLDNASSDLMKALLSDGFSIFRVIRRFSKRTVLRTADMSNTLTNSVIALYCILLYCLVLKCIVLLIYCYVDIIQYNAN